MQANKNTSKLGHTFTFSVSVHDSSTVIPVSLFWCENPEELRGRRDICCQEEYLGWFIATPKTVGERERAEPTSGGESSRVLFFRPSDSDTRLYPKTRTERERGYFSSTEIQREWRGGGWGRGWTAHEDAFLYPVWTFLYTRVCLSSTDGIERWKEEKKE